MTIDSSRLGLIARLPSPNSALNHIATVAGNSGCRLIGGLPVDVERVSLVKSQFPLFTRTHADPAVRRRHQAQLEYPAVTMFGKRLDNVER